MHTYIPIKEKNIHINGRTVMADPLPLFWTGSGVEFDVDGSELYFDFTTDYELYEQWIRIEIDGFSMIRMPLPKGESHICAFRNMPPETVKHVQLIKEVQAMSADPKAKLLLNAIWADGGLQPLQGKKMNIEFIGDSITSGEGLAGPQSMQLWASIIFSTANHYALEVGKQLDADVRILSQSGWGACCSWDNNPDQTLPPFYEQVCGLLSGKTNESLGALRPQDFSAWQPDVVIVNLGTNDASAFENPVSEELSTDGRHMKKNPDGSFEEESVRVFKQCVFDFLTKLRKNNPNAQIFWALGILGEVMRPHIEAAIEQYRTVSGDNRVEYLPLPNMRDEWAGSNNHPGAAAHQAAARVIIDRIQQL